MLSNVDDLTIECHRPITGLFHTLQYGVESVLGALIKLARLSDVPFGKGVHRAWHLNLELTISGLLCDELGSCITRPDFGSGLGSYTPRLPDGNFRSGLAVCKAGFPSSYFLS
jgi:hypothetical protein